MEKAQIAVLGLGVMGQNLALNIRDRGYRVALWNRTPQKAEQLALQGGMEACGSLEQLVGRLERPRKLLLMVQADAMDGLLGQLTPLLEPGDLVIDGGNSHYRETERRLKELAAHRIHYLGVGVSGGEEGARHGPSIMPGGSPEAWPLVQPILQAIAARVEGEPCCNWVGAGGAGHAVKMVHNGIEYAEMQLIAEAYQLLRSGLGLGLEETQRAFAQWNQGPLQSFLMEITAEILTVREADGTPLVDRIVDVAGQKGTGRWTVEAALEVGASTTTIAEAVFARITSGMKPLRERVGQLAPIKERHFPGSKEQWIDALGKALYGAKILTYVQGLDLIGRLSRAYNWNVDLSAAVRLWRGGCIIRSVLLEPLAEAAKEENLLFEAALRSAVVECDGPWRELVAQAALSALPVPCLSSALVAWDSLRSPQLPANIIQAQRDYFGAHTYERTDAPRGQMFHSQWSQLVLK